MSASSRYLFLPKVINKISIWRQMVLKVYTQRHIFERTWVALLWYMKSHVGYRPSGCVLIQEASSRVIVMLKWHHYVTFMKPLLNTNVDSKWWVKKHACTIHVIQCINLNTIVYNKFCAKSSPKFTFLKSFQEIKLSLLPCFSYCQPIKLISKSAHKLCWLLS